MQYSNIIDNHVHIDFYNDQELKEICSRNYKLFAVSTNYQSALKLLDIQKKYPNVQIAFGIHPEYFDYYNQFEQIKKLIIENQNSIYAIGEVGLPYFYLEKLDEKEKNIIKKKGEDLFVEFVKLSKKINKPLQIHGTGTSTKKVLEILEEYKIKSALFHWLNTDIDLHKSLIEKGFYFSISLDYLYNENYRDYINKLPLKNFLLESDGPWSYDDINKSYPWEIENLIDKLAKDRGISRETIIDLNNCYNKKLFGG